MPEAEHMTRIRLDQEIVTFGRHGDNGYVLADPRVSRVHAELRKKATSSA
jgi:pSer/pThr/pTyr-binding forkhead associated (FHA) protein